MEKAIPTNTETNGTIVKTFVNANTNNRTKNILKLDNKLIHLFK